MKKIQINWQSDEALAASLLEAIPTIEEILSDVMRRPCNLHDLINDPKQIVVSRDIAHWNRQGVPIEDVEEDIAACADIVETTDQRLAEEIRTINLREIETDDVAKLDLQHKIKWITTRISADMSEDAKIAIKCLLRRIRSAERYTGMLGRYDRKTNTFKFYRSLIAVYARMYMEDEPDVALAQFCNLCFRAYVCEEVKKAGIKLSRGGDENAIDAMAAYFEVVACRKLGMMSLSESRESEWEFHCSEKWGESLAVPMLHQDKMSGDTLRAVYGRLLRKDGAYDQVKACKVLWES